eukprot:scaffold5819_cov148-Skeletonema_menzelii.AAC.18
MDEFFIKSTAEAEIMSTTAAPDEQLGQPQQLGELQDDQEISGLTMESKPPSSLSGRRHQPKLSSSLSNSGSGGKSSGRFSKLFLAVVTGVVLFYLTHGYGGVKVSGGSIDRPDKPSTSTTNTVHHITDTFKKEKLQDTRRASTELNDLTHNNYRGEKQDHQMSFETWEASLNIERAVFLSEDNDGGGGGQNNNSLEDIDEDSVNRRLSFAEPKYHAADGCVRPGEVQTDICLASEHSSDVAVNCCEGSVEKNNLKCNRDGCEKRSTFAKAKNYCEQKAECVAF